MFRRRKGNMKGGFSTGSFESSKTLSKRHKETYDKAFMKGLKYQIVTTREYKGVTDADVDLRMKYAKSLISNATGTDKKLITFQKKSDVQTLTSVNEVYYVRLGGKSYGKLSIRIQFLKRGNDIYFILRRKAGLKPHGEQGIL